LIYRAQQKWMWGLVVLSVWLTCDVAAAQSDGAKPRLSLDPSRSPRRQAPRQTATIHWQSVPLRDAIARLKPLFDETVFVDRRVDPTLRVTLDIEATSAEQVMNALAAAQDLGVARLGKLIYLGPSAAASQLPAIAALRGKEAARLPLEMRTSLAGRKRFSWPRLSEPRQFVESLSRENGWRLGEAERIPHDLWAAGELPELSAAEQLTVLLFGFDLTFELKPAERKILIVPLPEPAKMAATRPASERTTTKPPGVRAGRGKKQVYTLRVQEKPVGAVLRELGQRLHWAIQIDEEAIRAAGKSLDQRVTFSVENADQEKLLDALLTPAGLEYRIDGNEVHVMPKRYDTN
jgi:type II secretory pathway component GspD/PulD (secretin)